MAVIKQPGEELEKWNPRTELGRKVKNKEITDIDQICDNGIRILESEIVDTLLPDLHVELMAVGQSKGKFGGGKSSIWKQTQKKTSEGNRIKFSTSAVIGNNDGYVGIGFAGAKETVPAREKAMRYAKLNIIKIVRGCGSWACGCKGGHSIPFRVSGKCGSVCIFLMPAPRGTGLKIEKKCAKMLELAGIKDVYSRIEGSTSTKLNLFMACFAALKNLSKIKVKPELIEICGIVEGKIKN